MATFGELQTKASTRLKDANNTAVSSADVADVINDAIQHWSKKRFWFNEFKEDVTLAVGDPVLPALPNNVTPLYLFQENGLVINYASTRWPLAKVSPAEYDDLNAEGKGLPFAWTQRGDGLAIELYWYPDVAYTAVARGVKAYDRFATNGNENNLTNDFTVEAPDLILYEALSRLYGEFRQDPKMEEYYSNRAVNEYKNLNGQTRRNKATGRIQVQGF